MHEWACDCPWRCVWVTALVSAACIHIQSSILHQLFFINNAAFFIIIFLLPIRCMFIREQQKAYRLTGNIPLPRSCPHPRHEPGAGRQTFPWGHREEQQPSTDTASYSTQEHCRWHQWFSASPCSGTSPGLGESAEIVTELWLLKVTAVM